MPKSSHSHVAKCPIIAAIENRTPKYFGRGIVLVFFALVFVFLAVGSNSGSSPSSLPSKGEVREACTQLSNAIQAQQSGNVAGAQEEFAWALMHAQASPDRALYRDIYVLEKATNAIVTAGATERADQQWMAVGRTAVSECRNQGAWPSG
jgi:hypothetical protein